MTETGPGEIGSPGYLAAKHRSDSDGGRGGCCRKRADSTKEGSRACSIVLSRALACKGGGAFWLNVAVAVPPPALDGPIRMIATGWLSIVRDVTADSVAPAPPTPPPRLTIA